MGAILTFLLIASGIGSFICFIFVWIKLIADKGAWWGIFGFLCGIYTFIWGWQNASRFAIQQTMLIWSICLGVSILANIFSSALLAGS